MQYKVLPCPDNLPIPQIENTFFISGHLAENYMKGELSDILEQDYKKHRAVGSRIVEEEKLEPVTNFSAKEIEGKEIIEKD